MIHTFKFRRFYSTIFLLILSSFFVFGQSNLLAHYIFDGHTEDVSGNGWHATPHWGPWFSGGINGQAVNFDGKNDYLTISDSEDFQLPNDFTVAAWVNVDTIADPPLLYAGFQAVFVKASTLYGGPFWCGLRGRDVVFLIGDGTGEDEGLVSGPIISEDSTYHIAWVLDQGNMYIYVNCILVASRDNAPMIIQNSDTVSIGGRVAEDGIFRNRLKGWIDDLRVYGGALPMDTICRIVPTRDVHLADRNILISPNPNSGLFNVKFERETSQYLRICIFDILGHKVKEQKLARGISSLDFDLLEKEEGIYLLVVQDEAGRFLQQRKIILAQK